ncbi:MAG: phage GP46 family protein [Tistlia sp.]|uniref:phage GP46 family protein n=1 Tax=Tistlia sp. TaxID=3057121 RepID=UPI0034A35C7C
MDLLLAFDEELLTGDLRQLGAGLETDQGLRTAVVLSLFSDRRAEADDELPIGETDRRGWWGDSLAEIAGDRIGSRLWLLARRKILPATLVEARQMVEESLAWLIEDGIAARIEVEVTHRPPTTLAIRVGIVQPRGDRVDYSFESLWQGVREASV